MKVLLIKPNNLADHIQPSLDLDHCDCRIGFRSDSQKKRKGTTVAKMKENIALIRKHGFPVAGFFILGYPTETREEMMATIRLAKELDLLRANFFTYLPLPGTSSYNELVASGEIEKVDGNNYTFMTAPYTPAGITRQELLALKKKAFLSFHLNPRVLFYNLMNIKSYAHFKFLSRRFYHWILMRPDGKTQDTDSVFSRIRRKTDDTVGSGDRSSELTPAVKT